MKICLKFLAVTILDIDAYMIIVYIQLNQQEESTTSIKT